MQSIYFKTISDVRILNKNQKISKHFSYEYFSVVDDNRLHIVHFLEIILINKTYCLYSFSLWKTDSLHLYVLAT